MEGVARPVDDRLQQLVPGARGRRQARDIVEEAQLVELVGPARSAGPRAMASSTGGRSVAGGRRSAPVVDRSSSSRYKGRKGCGRRRLRRVLARLRQRPASRDAPFGGRDRAAGAVPRAARGAGGHRVGRRARPAGARGPAARRAARPGHHRAGRARTIYELVERLRRRAIALRQERRPERPGAAGGRARRPRPGRHGGGHLGLLPVLPARQPRRGARPRPGAPAPRAGRARRAPRRLGRPRRSRGSAGPAATTRSSTRCSAGLRITPGPDRPSDRGPPADRAHRPAPLRGPARAARRPAADAVGGPRDPAPPARGDHAPVAHVRPALGRARAARRGAHGDGRLRCDAVHARAAAVPRDRRRARRPARPGGPRTGDAAAARPGVRAVRIVDRRRPRRQPGRDRGDDRADRAHPGRPRPARLRGGGAAAHADRVRGDGVERGRRRGRSRPASLATPRRCPRPSASSAGASRTSRTASGSGSSPSACAGRAWP